MWCVKERTTAPSLTLKRLTVLGGTFIEWRQQLKEEMFRARCLLARALRDDEAAYGGVELLMAAEVQRRQRRAAGELERMVGKRFHST